MGSDNTALDVVAESAAESTTQSVPRPREPEAPARPRHTPHQHDRRCWWDFRVPGWRCPPSSG
jgi:hypothetical protein